MQATHGIAPPIPFNQQEPDPTDPKCELKDTFSQPAEPPPDAHPPCWYAAHPQDPPLLWPCHANGLSLYLALRTQWRTGWSGATGLDYAAWRTVAVDALCIPAADLPDAFASMQAFEAAQLNAWYQEREQQDRHAAEQRRGYER